MVLVLQFYLLPICGNWGSDKLCDLSRGHEQQDSGKRGEESAMHFGSPLRKGQHEQ